MPPSLIERLFGATDKLSAEFLLLKITFSHLYIDRLNVGSLLFCKTTDNLKLYAFLGSIFSLSADATPYSAVKLIHWSSWKNRQKSQMDTNSSWVSFCLWHHKVFWRFPNMEADSCLFLFSTSAFSVWVSSSPPKKSFLHSISTSASTFLISNNFIHICRIIQFNKTYSSTAEGEFYHPNFLWKI